MAVPVPVARKVFLSTYPVRGTTRCFPFLRTGGIISIHVPRAGYDLGLRPLTLRDLYFYPRTPCGVRRSFCPPARSCSTFLSTYPVRGTTWAGISEDEFNEISIHVPRAGYDLMPNSPLCTPSNFYPRTPCGVRRIWQIQQLKARVFLSTYPVRGTTIQSW